MNREKRIRNPSKPYFPTSRLKRTKAPRSEKRLKLSEDQYAIIGLPPKFLLGNDIYLLPGNIPCSQREDSFTMDFSWLNEFHSFREVEIGGEENFMRIHVERRTDSRFPRLKNFLNRLLKMRNRELRLWGRTIKGFYESCKKITKQLIDQPNEFNLQFEINQEERGKCESVSHCCLGLRSHFRGSESRLTQITVNDNLIKMLGYNMQTFCSHVLQEGLPAIFASHDEKNSKLLFEILKEFGEVSVEMPSRKTSFFEASIKAKSGYVKKVKVKVEFMISYQNKRFESDLNFHIQNNEGPYYFPDNQEEQKINKHFLDVMKEREEHFKEFLQKYYHLPVQLQYSNLDKICRFQEF